MLTKVSSARNILQVCKNKIVVIRASCHKCIDLFYQDSQQTVALQWQDKIIQEDSLCKHAIESLMCAMNCGHTFSDTFLNKFEIWYVLEQTIGYQEMFGFTFCINNTRKQGKFLGFV